MYSGKAGRAMVFCPTKAEADQLVLSNVIKTECHVMHGDIPQDKRELVLQVRIYLLIPQACEICLS